MQREPEDPLEYATPKRPRRRWMALDIVVLVICLMVGVGYLAYLALMLVPTFL
jgi:hypothetical protein